MSVTFTLFPCLCRLCPRLNMNNILSSFSRLCGGSRFISIPTRNLTLPGTSHLRLFSSWNAPRSEIAPQISRCGPLSSQAEGSGVFKQLPWQYQQVRTRKRGTEYQPKNIKRKRTHGWIKRLSSQGGIEVLLRRMLKGRKSLSH